MKELSVFIDESGDFGEYDHHSPWYIVALVVHDQGIDISNDLAKLDSEISSIDLKDHTFHAGPIIRGEEEFRYLDEDERRKVFMKMMSFFRNIDIAYTFAVVEKKHTDNTMEVLVINGAGRIGYLDLYDKYHNQYYEVKSYPQSSTSSTEKQMLRYDKSKIYDRRLKSYRNNPFPTRGLYKFKEIMITYGFYDITINVVANGLIAYKPVFNLYRAINMLGIVGALTLLNKIPNYLRKVIPKYAPAPAYGY